MALEFVLLPRSLFYEESWEIWVDRFFWLFSEDWYKKSLRAVAYLFNDAFWSSQAALFAYRIH